MRGETKWQTLGIGPHQNPHLSVASKEISRGTNSSEQTAKYTTVSISVNRKDLEKMRNVQAISLNAASLFSALYLVPKKRLKRIRLENHKRGNEMGSNQKMTFEEFQNAMKEKYGGYQTRRWSNYPNSVFFYLEDIEVFGNTDNIGIWTDEHTYSLEPAWREDRRVYTY